MTSADDKLFVVAYDKDGTPHDVVLNTALMDERVVSFETPGGHHCLKYISSVGTEHNIISVSENNKLIEATLDGFMDTPAAVSRGQVSWAGGRAVKSDQQSISFLNDKGEIEWMDFSPATHNVRFSDDNLLWLEEFGTNKKIVKLHNPYGPAWINPGSHLCWAVDGKYHRDDGPAIYWYNKAINGSYYLEGKTCSKAALAKYKPKPEQVAEQPESSGLALTGLGALAISGLLGVIATKKSKVVKRKEVVVQEQVREQEQPEEV